MSIILPLLFIILQNHFITTKYCKPKTIQQRLFNQKQSISPSNLKSIHHPTHQTIDKDTILKYHPQDDDFIITQQQEKYKTKEIDKDGEIDKKDKDGEIDKKDKDGEIDKKDKDGEIDKKDKDGEIDKKDKDGEIDNGDGKKEKKDFHFRDFLSQYGSIDGLMTEIINNDKFQEIALFIRQYPFVRNVLKLLFDLGLGGMRANGCSTCSKGVSGGDSFASRRFEKGKTTLKKEDFENLLLILDKLKDTIEGDPQLLDFATKFETDPWNSVQLIFEPTMLKKIFDALELHKFYGRNRYTGMKRTFNDILREIEID